MRKKTNILQKLNLTNRIAYIIFAVSLILIFAPYISGSGLIKILPLNNNLLTLFQFVGILIFLFSIFLLIPVWAEKTESDRTENFHLSSDNKSVKTKFSGTKSEKLIDETDNLTSDTDNSHKNITRILRNEIKSKDVVYVKTENSTYKICSTQNDYYKVTGGWFSKGGRSGSELRIIGCVKDNKDNSSKKKVYKDYIASCNMCIKFGNGLITSTVKRIRIKKINVE